MGITLSARARALLPVALPAGQITLAVGPVLPAKIFRFAMPPNHPYNSRHPAPARGAYRDRHGRWARDAMDAAVSGANGIAGRISVSDQPARRRPALKRLRRNFGRQHMSRSRRFGGGSRGRQKRVVLAPVAGVKLMEIFRARPGFGKIANPSATEAKGIRLRGERAISRKTIAQGRPGVPAHLAVTRVHFVHTIAGA